jgi:integrase
MMGIAKAREAGKTLRVKVRQDGADPVADRRRERAAGRDANAGIGTLSALLGLYETQAAKPQKRWPDCRRRIESVFAAHLNRPLATLKAPELQFTADTWRSPQSAAAAVRYLRPILRWAIHRQYVATDAVGIVPPTTVRRRDRVLTRAELAKLLPVLRLSNRPYAACMRFLLLTLTRREEAAAARWRDIDLTVRTWTISDTKNGQPHVVPLPRQALDLLLDRLPVEADGNRIIDPDALVFSTRTGGRLQKWDSETKALQKDSDTSGWTRHDLRRTGATMLGEMGVLPDIIEAALNHVAIHSPLAATYNRSRYRPQVAAALQRLADALDGIEDGAEVIVSFPMAH